MHKLPIILKYLLPLILVSWCAVLLAHKIDLSTADLGRHLKNGEIIVHSSWQDKWAVLHTNFYSYTEPDREFVNHHWLSGVAFYFIHSAFGFKGLSVFYVVLVTAAFLFFYLLAQKRAGPAIASILAILVLPIVTSRTEIRPEGFTYFFMAAFYWVLWASRKASTSLSLDKLETSPHVLGRKIWLLPLAMLLWVNLHIGFIFGFLILGAFWLSAFLSSWTRSWIEKNRLFDGKLKQLSIIGVLCLIAGMINPFGIHGLLYPLNIFREYGYLIVENQSVMFLERLGMGSALYFGLFKFLLVLALSSFIALWVKSRGKEKNIHEFLLLGTAAFLALFATRNFPVFGLLFLPIAAQNIKDIMPEVRHPAYKIMPAVIGIIVIIFGSFRFWENYQSRQSTFGLGLLSAVNGAAEFFKKEKFKGPVFNNYDIGGYLIYHLYPLSLNPSPSRVEGRVGVVFTDNRPEAYSVDHFQKDYIPAQQDSVKWKELDKKNNFNVIFFSHRDLTPWGQTFLISRVQDPEWAPVYADGFNIIFLKRNLENREIIDRFELPKDNFRIISQ